MQGGTKCRVVKRERAAKKVHKNIDKTKKPTKTIIIIHYPPTLDIHQPLFTKIAIPLYSYISYLADNLDKINKKN